MGTIEIFLCIFLGHFIAAQSVIKKQDDTFFHDIRPFPFERSFDFPPYDTIFSSWRTRKPDFHMLAELPPIMIVPRIEVFCDESKLTLLVDKSSNGVVLTGEEIQLGAGCYSNRELPNQFVFTYSLDECGTTPMMQNGLVRFTNYLHLNLKKPPPSWWHTPSTLHVSCVPKRSYPNFFDSTPVPKNSETFNIKAMNPSWTSTAETNIFKRGQVVNLQVSAKTRPEQQLFIQSCFVSASPEPQTRLKHAVIMNKGCTAPLGSPHAVVQFVASDRADGVNFVLNTSYLISEMYIHCRVLLSDQGVNFGFKSCNYNLLQSRWVDLSGNVEVCECCSSKCTGLSIKHLAEDAKAIVSTGPFVIVDKHIEISPEPPVPEPQETSSSPLPDPMLSDRAVTEDPIISGASVSRPPQGVVVASQDPVAKLTLWLPGQVQDGEHGENIVSEPEDHLKLQPSDTVSNDLPELRPSTADQEPLLSTNTIYPSANEPGSDGRMWDLSLLTLIDGWALLPQMVKAAFAEKSQRKRRFDSSGMVYTEAPREVDLPLTAEMNVDVLNQNDFNQMIDELADATVTPQEDANDAQPIIRSKLQFSKSTDGSQTLSYEEEVMRQQEGKGGTKGKQEPRQRRLRSAFLDLLRRMDKAE
ncbi:zona pellucida protein C [Sebastes fasciatus]|uniref:zona pellucida protein C n=1 Tax=Sebastes fasciatus TaxID=394691 RepID=UPI003D9F851D